MTLNIINFGDIFKNDFLKNFSSNVSSETICVTLLYAFLLSLFVYFIYKFTTKNVIYSKVFNSTMALISIVTAGVVLSMQANIVVSLGMVGALSIVRFRTAVKDPRDLLFLFWSISNGIIIGAQIYSLAFILSIVVALGMLFYDLIPEKKLPYLLVIDAKSDDKLISKIEDKIREGKIKYRVKSRNINHSNMNIIYEVSIKKNNTIIKDIYSIKGINEVSLLSQDGETNY